MSTNNIIIDGKEYEPRLIPWIFLGKRIGSKLVMYPVNNKK